jgi:uncharacterized protein YkwD
MRRLRFLLPALALAATLLTLPIAPSAGAATRAAACRGANLAPSPAHAVAIRRATLCLLNRQRAAHRLPRLREHRSLTHAATKYARQMVAQRFFDHVSPAGSTMAQRIKRTHYLKHTRGWSLGENLAWGSGGAATPARIVNAWMHSAGHRANILDRAFREIGIGVALGSPHGRSGATYVNEFGRRARA